MFQTFPPKLDLKWFIQACDPMSAGIIDKFTKQSLIYAPHRRLGFPERFGYNNYRLLLVNWDIIAKLLEETSLAALNCGRTDYGANFYVYVQYPKDKHPRFCFVSNNTTRRENGCQHKKMRGKRNFKFCLIDEKHLYPSVTEGL